MRFFFLGSGAVVWPGIWLSGFTQVHGAAVTGICPGIILSNRLFGKNDSRD